MTQIRENTEAIRRLVQWWRIACSFAIGIAVCVAALPAIAQKETFRVELADGRTFTYPIQTHGAERYVALSNVNALLKAIDPSANVQWNASTGVYRVQSKAWDFSLYQRQAVLLYNNAIIRTRLPLLMIRGRVLVPVDSLNRLLRYFENVSANVSSAQPTDSSSASTIEPAADSSEASESEPIPSNFSHSVEGIVKQTVRRDASGNYSIGELKRAAALLGERQTIVLDPQPFGLALSATSDTLARSDSGDDPGANLTWRIASRCREILASNPELQVVLTRDSESQVTTPGERLAIVNQTKAKALVCLRVDSSRFKAAGGYRLFVPNRATDPSAREASVRDDSGEAPPMDKLYIPYENASLLLSRYMDEEMSRSGLVRASPPLGLAPFFFLKRADTASVSISLGHWTNDADRARLEESGYVEAAAASLAQGLLRFGRWIDRNAAEKP